jgi:sugar phosphate isomerase/epimerase
VSDDDPRVLESYESMKISALTSSLPMALPAAIEAIADLGLQWIDVPPTAADPEIRQALRRRDLQVASVGLERDQPEGIDLSSDDADVVNRARTYFRQAISQTAEIDASVGYVTPPTTTDASTLSRWTESMLELADHARKQGVKLCVEHFPGRALPTVAATLQFLEKTQHPAMALLLDVGHCLISGEDPGRSVIDAGDRLGYIHFDDNDGANDVHWALLDGRLTEQQIIDVIEAQKAIGYAGALCIELNPSLDEPHENLRRSRDVLRRCIDSMQ